MRLRCEGCGALAEAGPTRPWPFRCERAAAGEEHVLVPAFEPRGFPQAVGEGSPFEIFADLLPPLALAREHGVLDAALARARALDARVRAIDGVGLHVTPTGRQSALSEALGFSTGGVWIKDETGQAGGSHKARHLFGVLLHLEVAELLGWTTERPPLAIASCGNAALAAAVIARAADRRLMVFIPPTADPVVVARLRALEAEIEVAGRSPGEAGDPTYLRFEEAVSAGALPFCCQGPANGLTLFGGQTLGWELGHAMPEGIDHVVIQVGGGALASATIRALEQLVRWEALPRMPAVHTVQTKGAYPLQRAWIRCWRARSRFADLDGLMAHAAAHRGDFMWPWETTPQSAAHGILDDETYDWHRVVRGMLATGGDALAVDEQTLLRAHRLASGHAKVSASVTGAAGLAGLIALRRSGRIGPHERVAVLLTGVDRSAP